MNEEGSVENCGLLDSGELLQLVISWAEAKGNSTMTGSEEDLSPCGRSENLL